MAALSHSECGVALLRYGQGGSQHVVANPLTGEVASLGAGKWDIAFSNGWAFVRKARSDEDSVDDAMPRSLWVKGILKLNVGVSGDRRFVAGAGHSTRWLDAADMDYEHAYPVLKLAAHGVDEEVSLKVYCMASRRAGSQLFWQIREP